MSRSNMYAKVVDLTPVLAMMNEHANQGLPFISLEYGDDYLEWTQEGESTMPSLDEIESWNLDGINALEPEAWRHLLSIATKIVGLTFGTGGPGVSIRTSDGRNVSVVPVTREEAHKPLNEVERKIFEAETGKTNKMEPIGEVLEELRRDLREMKNAIDRYKDSADKNLIRVEVGSEGYPPDVETLVKGYRLAQAATKRCGV